MRYKAAFLPGKSPPSNVRSRAWINFFGSWLCAREFSRDFSIPTSVHHPLNSTNPSPPRRKIGKNVSRRKGPERFSICDNLAEREFIPTFVWIDFLPSSVWRKQSFPERESFQSFRDIGREMWRFGDSLTAWNRYCQDMVTTWQFKSKSLITLQDK